MNTFPSIVLSISLLSFINCFCSENNPPITSNTQKPILQICQQIIETPVLTAEQLPTAQACLSIIKFSTENNPQALQASKKIYDFITHNINDLLKNHRELVKNFIDQFNTIDLNQYCSEMAIIMSLIGLPLITAQLPSKDFLVQASVAVAELGKAWQAFDGSTAAWQALLTNLNNQSIIQFLTHYFYMNITHSQDQTCSHKHTLNIGLAHNN
jgi:hypothetical protein